MSSTLDSNNRRTARENRRMIRSLKVKADQKRSAPEKFADILTEKLGTFAFLAINGVWFAIWLILNTGIIPGLEPFDPFPFGLLTTIVSLEAIILAILVLISQNRAAKVAELREEMDLQVDMIAEEELTKLMRMTRLLLEKQGIDVSDDAELEEMLAPTDVDKLEEVLEDQIITQNPAKNGQQS